MAALLRTGETINAPDWVTDLVRCVALAVALWSASPAEIVAISQFMPPELRALIPRKHLN